jgi:hypothetical protein
MYLLKRLWPYFVFLLLGCSCSLVQRQLWRSPQPRLLLVWVALEAGRGLEEVDVTLFQLDDSGNYAQIGSGQPNELGLFRFQDLSAGEYYLEITKPRYDLYFEQFSVEEDEGVYLEVELRRYSIPQDVWQVLVVGDFMDWDPLRALPLTDDDGDGLWETTTPLPIGRYSYKYIINGLDEWFIDIKSGEYQPDGLGYYDSVIELPEAGLVSFVLDTNDPWFHRVAFEVPANEEVVGGVVWEPEEPRAGQWITIFYDPKGGPLEDAQQILLHWGVNDWKLPEVLPPDSGKAEEGRAVQTPLERDPDGIWWVVIPTDAQVRTVDFVFTDGQRWDNQAGDWHIPIR